MPVRDHSRRSEGVLTFGVLVVVGLALLLVYLSKGRAVAPDGAALINEATAATFAQRLGVEDEIAARLIAYRRQVGGFESVDQMLDAPLFSPAETAALAGKLMSAQLDLQTATARQFADALGLSPAVARRLAAYRDGLHALPPSVRSRTSPEALTRFLKRAPLLDPAVTRPLLGSFMARSPEQVSRLFWIGAALLLLAIFLLPPLLRARLGGDPYLLPLALLLAGCGVAMLFSIKDPLRDRAVYLHHLFGLVPALAGFFLLANLAPAARQQIRRYQYVWVFAVVALVAALFLFGSGPEGVKLNLFHFQPVEIIKVLLVFFLAGYLADRADLIADVSRPFRRPRPEPAGARQGMVALSLPRTQDLAPVAIMFAFTLTLFFVIKDLGPGLQMFATFVALLFLTTGRAGFALHGIALMLLGGVLGYAAHVGVFPIRVDMWLHPFANSHPNGMQLGQAYWAMASGGAEGSGLGMGMPGLIPRAGSDLAFVSWVEETGLLGAWLALAVFVVLVWRGLRIALRAGTSFDRALAFGLTALLGLQTLLIVAGVTGVVPLTGIALPFLSYGNSALVADFAMLGLLRGISASATTVPLDPRMEVTRAARWFGLAFGLALLGGIGLLKLGPLALLKADEIATRPIVTPDADKVARPHPNPRLLAMAAQIERGSIYDREGRVLATSRPAEIAAAVPDPAARQRPAARGRNYPLGPALAHLVGYLDPADGGPYGLEKSYDADLRGYARLADLLADYRDRNLPGYHARAGLDLHLTVDAPLQQAAQAILEKTAARLKDTITGKPKDRAAFVLMDPRTGDVLVAASIPTFDPNTLTPDLVRRYTTGPDAETEHRFVDRAVAGLYPPGSSLKVATAACALDHLPGALDFTAVCDRVDPQIRWRANGLTYVRRNVRDDVGDPAFGRITLPMAFRVSSNIYFANLAVAIGADTFRQTLIEKMGFKHTPSPAAFAADLPDIGYGQGRMLASPLAMARLAASVANDGTMMPPRLVARLHDPTGRSKDIVLAPAASSQAMAARTAAILRGLMRSVVTDGTARGAFDGLSVEVAGKTGTAQNHQYDRQPHSWFIGFAPYLPEGSPPPTVRYAFACLVENGGYGRRVAAVICHDVLAKLF
ncbi:MAG TPA: FtsW/RodA/SpoVE family cell cycle protein [Chthonomonadaceae bacterium]|nr:FtsW/RodA/SpoVE family cell cycle protein [Chthonomonadaceae bacterium]